MSDIDFVISLMTPEDQLLCVSQDDDKTLVLNAAKEKNYDIVPWRCSQNDAITQIVRVESGELEPLTSRWLVSSDTPVLELLDIFMERKPAVRLVLHGNMIVGLVSDVDLNKIPARTFLYTEVGKLEMALARYVKGKIQDEGEILSLLNKDYPIEQTNEQQENAMPVLDLLQFSDLLNVLCKSKVCRDGLGLESSKKAKKLCSGLVLFRNSVMHPVRYLLYKQELTKLSDRLKRLQELYRLINHALDLETTDL